MKNKQIDRRNFMKGTAMATGGVMMAGLPVGASAFVNPQAKKLKLAVVGCGGRGTGATVQALTADPDVQLVAMADAFKDRIDSSLNNIMKSDLADDRKKNIKIKEKNKFAGFDAYKDAIKEADAVKLTKLEDKEHKTLPPPRYGEAALIKTLEKYGIGRPSTYATIISTVQDRNYIEKNEQRKFAPTEKGILVNDMLANV